MSEILEEPEIDLGRPTGKVISVLSFTLVAGSVAWILDLPQFAGLSLYTEQLLALALGCSLGLLYLMFNAGGGRQTAPPWYDRLAAFAGFAACLYLALRYPSLVAEMVGRPWDGILIATIVVALTVEGVRRTAGMSLAVVILLFILYALAGHLLPEAFATRPVSASRLAVYLGIDTNALLGAPMHVAVVVVLPFVIMGQLLSRCGGTDYFTDLAMALMGRFRGGAAKIAVVGSAFFGMISGSAVANVAGVGVITIPLMKRSGFSGPMAGAIEAVGSTGGQLMPPVMGAAAFLMAEYMQVPYSAVVTAAAIPALLYYMALFIQVDFEAGRLGIAGAPVADLPRVRDVLRAGWHFPIPFALLVVGLLNFNLQAEYAALLACAALVFNATVFGYRGKRMSLKGAFGAFVGAGPAVVDMVVITAGAGLVIGVLNLSGLAFGLTLQLLHLSGNSLTILLLLTAVIGIVLGMGMPTVGVYVILASLAAPALIQAGLTPMQAHMFVMYFGMMSMVTPPVALAAFTAANIAQADPWKTGWMAARVGWCAYIVPFLFCFAPSLLFEGPGIDIAIDTVTAIIGIAFITAAFTGFIVTRVGLPMRIAFGIAGVMLLIPGSASFGSRTGEAIGLLVGAALLAKTYLDARTAKRLAGTG